MKLTPTDLLWIIIINFNEKKLCNFEFSDTVNLFLGSEIWVDFFAIDKKDAE